MVPEQGGRSSESGIRGILVLYPVIFGGVLFNFMRGELVKFIMMCVYKI